MKKSVSQKKSMKMSQSSKKQELMEKKEETFNVIADLRKTKPMGKLIGICNDIVDNLYLSLMARLSEPDSVVIMNKDAKIPDASNSLSRALSSVNINSAEALLGQALMAFS